jgi:hypothetical protein
VKRCPEDADRIRENFKECIRDYLEAVAGFPNIGDQLIRWLCMAKKPALMPMHKFMRCQLQLLSYLKGSYLHRTMDVPTAQEKSEKIFFAQPKAHQKKFANLNKMVPANPLRMIAFFEQCQATNKAAVILEKIAKDKKRQRKRVRLMFQLHVAVNRATSNTIATNIATTIEATEVIATIANLTIIIKTINAMIVVDTTTRA